MTDDPIKIQLDSSTYVTKVNGRLVLVRERRERLRDICLDLLGEVFSKYSRRIMKEGSKIVQGENAPAQNPTAMPIQNFPTPLPHNPNANLVRPAPAQSVMGPMGPQPGIYRFGDRQLALLPLNSQGGQAMAPQMGYSHPQPPWMFPQSSSLRGFNFPLNGIDPQQFMMNSVPLREVAGQTSVTVTKHVCAECGKLRSRKYQHENPLRPGETPSPAFCRKCQKDITSTEESDSSIRNIEKHRKRSKRGHKRRTKVQNDKYSSDESLGSNVSQKVSSKPKQNESQNQSLDRDIAREGHRAKHKHRSRRIPLHDIESYIDGHEEVPTSPEKLHVRQIRSTALPQDFEKYPPVHHSRVNLQAQTSSRDSVGMDAAESFHHNRRELSQTTYERSETDRSSKQVHRRQDPESSEATASGNYNFKDPIASILRTRSEEASRRRRLERSTGRQGSHRQAIGLPYGIHPSEDDEVIVETERYVIRPRPPPSIQEGSLASRRQSSVDKTTARAEKIYPQFVAEAETSDYRRNNWPRVGEYNEPDHDRVSQRGLEGLAALVNSHSSETNSSSSYQAARTDDDYVPRAPSPLSPLHQRIGLRTLDTSHHEVSYLPSEDESLPSRLKGKYNTARSRISSTYRPPYVREATDRGTERVLMPSPKHLHEKMFYPDTNDSEITEEIERAERHVTFHDSDEYEKNYHILNRKIGSGQGLREKGRR